MNADTCPTCHYALEMDGTCRPCFKDRVYQSVIQKALRWGRANETSRRMPRWLLEELEDADIRAGEYD